MESRRLLTAVVVAALSMGIFAAPRRSDSISLRSPLDIPLLLSGNFAELRRNHFHSGIDFKTQGKTGLPVHAVDDGYVSRISVSPWGFGRAVYITHPSTGLTSVYGHLEAFSPAIDKAVRDEQYSRETFSIDLTFDSSRFPVKKGDVVGMSGNAGSSGGPHLHLDIRDTSTEDPLDPLEYFRSRIKDAVAPEVRQLAIYPVNGGIVENSTSAVYRQPDGTLSFTAWGDIVPGIKAYDRMSGTSNIYGVKYLTLLQDGDTIYNRVMDRFSFDDTKAVHTIINNRDLVDKSTWIMTTRVPQAHPLNYMIDARNNGIVTINEERPYKFTWILRDEHGNTSRKSFTVTGKRKLGELPVSEGQLSLWDADNVIETEKTYLEIPAGALYDNEFITVKETSSGDYFSDIVEIGDEAIPLSKGLTLSLQLDTDTLADKSQYCLVKLNGAKQVAQPTRYADGTLTSPLKSFGKYAVTVDRKPPVITPVSRERWKPSGIIKFKITDNLSGVESYRGEIDGHFALFELDGKTATISFKLDKERFPGNSHEIKIIAVDGCGNTATETFKYR